MSDVLQRGAGTGTTTGDANVSSAEFTPRAVSPDVPVAIELVADTVGGAYRPHPESVGAVGYTHFDGPGSEDNSIVVLMARQDMAKLPLQSLVRIKSLDDDRKSVERMYLGVVVAGPFAEPDGMRADSPIVIATTVQGQIFLPHYHGRAHVQILGEEVNGQLVPPRFRPKPNSSVHALGGEETARALNLVGDLRLGLVVGQDELPVLIPTTEKAVLPRHSGVLGTTGSGKSNSIAREVHGLQQRGVATVLIDVEGEYTEIDRPTSQDNLKAALAERGMEPKGTPNVTIYHLVGRETSREAPGGDVRTFCLRFDELSPYTVADLLELNDAQRDRFFIAYETTQAVLRDLGISPATDEEKKALLARDEFETGYPRMTLSHLIDVAQAIHDRVSKIDEERSFFHADFQGDKAKGMIKARVDQANQRTDSRSSWRAVVNRLYQINRLRVFDNVAGGVKPLTYRDLIKSGRVSVIDLSDTDSTIMNNLVIASLLRGLQCAQEDAVDEAHRAKQKPTPVMVIIEEAHEFLSSDRIAEMPSVFQQVARIAKRGRKRWLGLTFVTQLPQHLPDEVLGLLNNFVLHKISDANVVARLRRSIGGLDAAQWEMLPGLAPGQAIVSFTSMTRPLLVSIDPSPSHVRLSD